MTRDDRVEIADDGTVVYRVGEPRMFLGAGEDSVSLEQARALAEAILATLDRVAAH